MKQSNVACLVKGNVPEPELVLWDCQVKTKYWERGFPSLVVYCQGAKTSIPARFAEARRTCKDFNHKQT